MQFKSGNHVEECCSDEDNFKLNQYLFEIYCLQSGPGICLLSRAFWIIEFICKFTQPKGKSAVATTHWGEH